MVRVIISFDLQVSGAKGVLECFDYGVWLRRPENSTPRDYHICTRTSRLVYRLCVQASIYLDVLVGILLS